MNAPRTQSIKSKEYKCKPSHFNVTLQLPIGSMNVGPSGGGKAVLTDTVPGIYKCCFSRIPMVSTNKFLFNMDTIK